jgi:hypothetical protein
MTPALLLLGLGSPVIGLAMCVAVHVLVSRSGRGLRRDLAAAAAAAVGLAATVLSACAGAGARGSDSPLDTAATLFLWLLAYVALVYAYVFGFFNLGESARRIRLLIELRAAGPQGLTREELLAAYNADMIVRARLARLLSAGQVVQRDGRYHVGSPLMLRLARTLVFLKRVYLGAPSEFEVQRSASPGSPSAYRA